MACTIIFNKKLSQHPSPLIAIICLVEAIMCWNALFSFLGPVNPICYFRLYQLYAWTSSTVGGPEDAFYVLVWSNEITMQFFQLMSLGFNLCLCIDLVLTLWSPFEVAKKRMTYYQLGSILVSTALVVIIWLRQDKEFFKNKNYQP